MRSTLGVVGSSAKKNEKRLPLHPEHIPGIDADLRSRITLEHGYGERFGVTDAYLSEHVAGFASREEILAASEVVLLPKPQYADLAAMSPGQILWGWPHCVQDTELTQLAIDRQLTLIAFEVMNYWAQDGGFATHVFQRNNEIAGYASVLHALALAGLTGTYGRPLSAVVIGRGATAKGSVTALHAHGVRDVTVLRRLHDAPMVEPPPGVRNVQFDPAPQGPHPSYVTTARGRTPLPTFLAATDIVVNCSLQDPTEPLVYLKREDLAGFRPGSVVVDVSCDLGMGFSWARPTSYDDPSFVVGNNVLYYAVDHSPSYLWRSATWEISNALLPFLRPMLSGSAAWEADETLRRAVEILEGRVVNPHILAFQGRSAEPPHTPMQSDPRAGRHAPPSPCA